MKTITRPWWADPDADFDRVIPWLRVSGGGKAGRKTPRFELPAPPPAILHLALSLRRRCVSCGRETPIFRERTVGFMGGKVSGSVYLTVLCDRPACTHGAARVAYHDLAEHILRSKPRQDALLEVDR